MSGTVPRQSGSDSATNQTVVSGILPCTQKRTQEYWRSQALAFAEILPPFGGSGVLHLRCVCGRNLYVLIWLVRATDSMDFGWILRAHKQLTWGESFDYV